MLMQGPLLSQVENAEIGGSVLCCAGGHLLYFDAKKGHKKKHTREKHADKGATESADFIQSNSFGEPPTFSS